MPPLLELAALSARPALRSPFGAALGALGAIAVLFVSSSARADPQFSTGLTGGYAFHRVRDGADSAGHLGVRGDVLLLRSRSSDGAVGPYVEALTVAFSDLQVGGGISALVPGPSIAVVPSLGVYARASDLGWRPGATGQLFVGFRGYNFHSRYAMANGLFAQGRLGLGETRQADVLLGVQVDLEIFALPVLLVWGALR